MSLNKVSPQSITYFLVGISLLPKLLSQFSDSASSIFIIMYWIAPSVLLPEFSKRYTLKNLSITKLPITTKFCIFICIILISISYFWQNQIYSENKYFINLRRGLYLVHPILFISWHAIIDKGNHMKFWKIFIPLNFGLVFILSWHITVGSNFIGQFFNEITSYISASILGLFYENNIYINKNYFYIEGSKIDVRTGCSAIPQITMAVYSILIFYLCCKIRSKFLLFLLIFLIIPFVFFSNCVRIAFLGYFTSKNDIKAFDFWHDGHGSLLYSFIIMILTCSFYYYLWSKENPRTDYQ